MARRSNRDQPEPDHRAEEPRQDGGEDTGQFALEETHERRILSWSPDPEEDLEPEIAEVEDDPPYLVDEVQEQAHVAAERHTEPVPQTAPVEASFPQQAPLGQQPARAVAGPPVPAPRELDEIVPAGQEPRRRGRPRGRPRRQVHFHVDPDDELLLLAAAKIHGSQQKGLVAALQALQDNEVLREEIERLRMECERQRVLLADAEAIFNR